MEIPFSYANIFFLETSTTLDLNIFSSTMIPTLHDGGVFYLNFLWNFYKEIKRLLNCFFMSCCILSEFQKSLKTVLKNVIP